MSVRIEVFSAVSIEPAPERAFVAILQTIGAKPINSNFYGETAKRARCAAEDWLAKEQKRLAEAGFKKEKEPVA